MRSSFKKRNTESFLNRLRSLLIEPSFIKFLSLVIVLGSVYSFKFWAERRPELPVESTRAAMEKERVPERRININAASRRELESLPGIGPHLAEAIVEHRHRNGPFREAKDLLAVRGIGPVKMSRLEPYLSFERSP